MKKPWLVYVGTFNSEDAAQKSAKGTKEMIKKETLIEPYGIQEIERGAIPYMEIPGQWSVWREKSHRTIDRCFLPQEPPEP